MFIFFYKYFVKSNFIYIFASLKQKSINFKKKKFMETIIKWFMYTVTFPYGFVVGFIEGWKSV